MDHGAFPLNRLEFGFHTRQPFEQIIPILSMGHVLCTCVTQIEAQSASQLALQFDDLADELLFRDDEASPIARRNEEPPLRIVDKDGYDVLVIAEVDGEWTMKYLRQQGKQVWLEAANPAYAPILPERELKIVAVVRAVVRKYA